VNNKIINFCKSSMEKWSTRLQLKTNQELLQSRLIKINRGIFQGDSLSPLLFCIALIPITNELNRIIRHDKICTHLHYSICKKLGIETAGNWYSHIPKPVTEHDKRMERFW
jgi:hypothetical protein